MSAKIITDLLIYGVTRCATRANNKGSAAFLASTQTPQAGADMRRYGVDVTAQAYGLRQEMDKYLFIEGLTSVVSSGSPTGDQISNVVGVHRRRWKR
jgi:hypothetical protein